MSEVPLRMALWERFFTPCAHFTGHPTRLIRGVRGWLVKGVQGVIRRTRSYKNAHPPRLLGGGVFL